MTAWRDNFIGVKRYQSYLMANSLTRSSTYQVIFYEIVLKKLGEHRSITFALGTFP